MSKEYTYDIDKYTIGVDENGEDEIGLTVAKVENGEIYFLGNCYGENARCLDLLIKENQELKKQVEETDRKLFLTKNELDMRQKSIDNKLNQQKKFIEWLEDYLKLLDYMCIDEQADYDMIEEILQKYKSIIGVSDESR